MGEKHIYQRVRKNPLDQRSTNEDEGAYEVETMNETVWSSWDEWRAVYTQLYSASLAQKDDACKRISAWTMRGRVPLPARATYSLIEAQLLDHSGSSSSSIEQVRLSYAMALVRLVNNAADDGQRGEYAQSIAILANRIGLPKWLVDVRHEATHQSLPSLQVLRLACAQALLWLDEHYWKRQWEELSKSHPNRLDAQIAEISKCLSIGAISRDIGPSLPANPKATSTTVNKTEPSQDSAGDADDEPEEDLGNTGRTAQDIVDLIKEYDPNRLAKSLFRVMMSEGEQFEWTKWERVLHWLDGEGSLRVCRKLLLVCFHEALKEGSVHQQRKVYSLISGLLSRRYHAETRASLAKHASKVLAIESSETWTKQERAFMHSFAPDACRAEVLAAVKRSLNRPSPQARKLLMEVLLPSLLKVPGPTTTKKSKTSHAAEQVYDAVESLFDLQKELIRLREHNGDSDEFSADLSQPNQELEQVLDWTVLSKFCDQVDLQGKKRLKQDMTEARSDVKSYGDLNGDGLQPWAKVEWRRLPIGALPSEPKRCPSLTVAPPLFVESESAEVSADDHPDDILTASAEYGAAWENPEDEEDRIDEESMRKMIAETSKKIRLLL